MLNQKVTRVFLWLAALALTVPAAPLRACSVPVFRYALEHWAADPYQAVVFHRGPLTATQEALVQEFSTNGWAGRLHANVHLHTIDLDQETAPEALEFWDQLKAPSLPWLVVRYPLGLRLPHNVWSGPLAAPALQRIFDSPARREIARRILDGQSGVWVMLEVGDPEFDLAAANMVESRLAYLMSVLQLPKLEAQDIASGLVSVTQDDLKLEFSLLRLSRKDPAEEVFVQMLLGTEADLHEIDAPMVFPVFGRGRALYALIGAGINSETMDEAAAFLIGKCSCQIKELNPGVDLLLAADWEGSLKKQARPAGELASYADPGEFAPVTVTISGGDDDSDRKAIASSRFSFGFFAAGGFAAVVLLGGILFFVRRR
jgi:hypothetical protein